MVRLFGRFLKDDRGATAVEYGLIAALISVMVVAVIPLLGPPLEALFKGTGDRLQSAGH
ncbi:Flp family type IVb pilin [Caulobacter flavus]|jgi:pilus assembly protein Flp/PilA|uniref:Flp family type IVb pilin n=1 Tax=Caulobacter flavus TaxID=1679497 RepID=A0A2N5CRE2_9CAUL|nr:Flp family type IVb pilin [Caulobacter flavus]AYV46168.1 Flp family type IVb pilin [Caulobacter flavus]PLR11543.1 Flp family type IVb pilin [Caulobacter flavus]